MKNKIEIYIDLVTWLCFYYISTYFMPAKPPMSYTGKILIIRRNFNVTNECYFIGTYNIYHLRYFATQTWISMVHNYFSVPTKKKKRKKKLFLPILSFKAKNTLIFVITRNYYDRWRAMRYMLKENRCANKHLRFSAF